MSRQIFDSLLARASRPRRFAQGQTLFARSDTVSHLYLLIGGRVALIRHGASGSPLILHQSRSGSVIAEASLYADTYHCDGVCEEESEIANLPIRSAKKILHGDPDLSVEWAASLARELQDTRHRCELLSRNTVSERLSGWLDWHKSLPPKGQWKDLATQLAVSPEALYRTIKKNFRTKERQS